MKIGNFIKQERKFRNLTIADLSAQSGVSKSALSRIERGESSQFEPISRILASLGYTAEDATKAGVNWWTEDSESLSENLEYIVSWLKKQDDDFIKQIRVLIEIIESKEV